MQDKLTLFLGWTPPLRSLTGGQSQLLDRIQVFVDFDWEAVRGRRKTFNNYKSLTIYVRSKSAPGKLPALILTDQPGQREGYVDHHPTHDIFVVHLDRYKSAAANDAAGAYFAGLTGAPIITATNLSSITITPNDLDAFLDAFASADSVAAWLNRNPEAKPTIALHISSDQPEATPIIDSIEELGKQLGTLTERQQKALSDLLCAKDFPRNLVRAAELTKRKDAVEEFKSQLALNAWGEGKWQDFFEREDWIFGHGLLYQFVKPVEREAYVGGKDVSNKGGQVADFSVRTIGAGSFTAIVDIKTPSARLMNLKPSSSKRTKQMNDSSYRNGAYAIHQDLADCVAQIQSNCDAWNISGSRLGVNERRGEREGWLTAQPRGIIVIGNQASCNTEDAEETSTIKRCFQLFRSQLHGIEILTFDELFARAEALADPKDYESDSCDESAAN
jgi:hypothetical protein